MSTNYNRIKVADLETNQRDKILTTNSKGELEFSDLNTIKTDTYNGLDYNQQDKALDARQGKVLKDLIDNKVDKVSGERLISTVEINKLSGLSNVVTTIKPILSTTLTTQDVAGFVSYINSLNPVLVVGSNEIVKFTTTDTGRVFQLNLRGRSFGTGQSLITVSDVVEITAFLNKDLKLSNYPSTRNDGQLPTNKVLSTDANGNLKMYNLPNFQAPFLGEVSPTFSPNSTGNLTLTGAFFTPSMTVSIAGQTVNYITFVNDNLIKVNITTGSDEGNFAITLNNGISVTFQNALSIVLGTIFKPSNSDWTSIINKPDLSKEGEMNLVNISLNSGATWNKNIDTSKRFRLLFSVVESPLVLRNSTSQIFDLMFMMTDSLTGDNYQAQIWLETNSQRAKFYWYKNGTQVGVNRYTRFGNFRIDYDGSYLYINQDFNNENNMSVIDTVTLNNNWKLSFWVKRFDIKNIKYIELG